MAGDAVDRLTKPSKHRPIEHRLRGWNRCIRIAHGGCRDEPAFDDQLGLHPEECWFPQHQVSDFPDLDGPNIGADGMADGWIDRILGQISFDAHIVVAWRVLWEWAALLLHLAGGLPRATDDFTHPPPVPGRRGPPRNPL